jgi:tRNA (mo5U34)-methyltransferase
MTSSSTGSQPDLEQLVAAVRERQWFYRFALPDGSETVPYVAEAVRGVHDTRLAMVRSVLEPLLASESLTALDMASHQGWFSTHLRKLGCARVTGFEPRQSHVDDARLIVQALGLDGIEFVQTDLAGLDAAGIEPADIVLCMGLIYHLQDPIAAIRAARRYCRRVCLIETQVGPHVSGMLDWGSYEFVRPIQGCFTIIDETDETHAGEAAIEGICLAPSTETLLWVMRKVGFRDVALVRVPEGGYEQHRHGKRVMAVGWV